MKITDEMLDLWEEADNTLPFDSLDNPHNSPEAFARAEAEHFLALLGPLILEAAARVVEEYPYSDPEKPHIAAAIRGLK